MAKKRKRSSSGARGRRGPGARPAVTAQAPPRSLGSRLRKWVLRGLAVGLVATLLTLSGSLPEHPSTGDIVLTIVVRTVAYGAVFSVFWFALDVGQTYWRRRQGTGENR